MYFDDGNLCDLASAKGSGQAVIRGLFECIGAPLSDEKRQRMSLEADFLGLAHNLRNALSEGTLTFWPRQ